MTLAKKPSNLISRLQIAVLLAVGVFAAFSSAQAASTESPYRVGPISSALGGSGRAAADPTEAGWLNPAALVHTRFYHLAFSHQQSHRNSGDGYRDFGVMFTDGGEEKIAAGSFSYVQRSTLQGGAGAVAGEQKDFQGSMAIFLPNRRTSIGATYRRLIHTQVGTELTQDTYSLGLLVPLSDTFGFAVVGQDLAGSSSSAPFEARFVPSVAVALHQRLQEILELRGDVIRPLRENEEGKMDFRVGLESWFRPDFAFRLGGAWLETRKEMWMTAGIGFKGPKLSFGYSFEKEMRSSDGTRHTFDLWLPL